jgi:DNA polymerase elongation subunit (family B)
MRFYTNAHLRGNTIFLRGYHDNKKITSKIEYQPYLFVPSKKTNPEYKTISGAMVDKIVFDSIKDAKEFLQTYDDVSGFGIYGMDRFIYPFLNDEFPGDIQYDKDQIRVANIDIEVDSSDGFPSIESANKAITAITVEYKKTYHVFTTVKYTKHRDDVEVYYYGSSEKDMLKSFLHWWKKTDFDVVTGWNVEFFDIPYLVNRIRNLIGNDWSNNLSPWGMLRERTVKMWNKDQQLYDIIGMAVLDYQQLYTKFTYTKQESYRLDHIAYVELGERKMDYSEYESLSDLCIQNPQKFIEYNIRDVELITKLEEKMALIELAYAIAYDAKVNLEDAFTSVLLWDVIIHNYMLSKNIVVNQTKKGDKDRQFEGAFVMDPVTGIHDWVASFDVNSLYPSLIVQYNMSPETYRGMIPNFKSIDNLLKHGESVSDIIDLAKKDNLAVAANGTCWDKTEKGIFPQLVEHMIEQRVFFKNKMTEAKKRKQVEGKSKQVEADISKYNNLQMAKKIILNSLFGAVGNAYFRWYKLQFAEAITFSGQYSIRFIGNAMDEYMKKLTGKKDYRFVIASDTDSIYLRLGPLVELAYESDAPKEKVVDFLDKVCKQKLEPFIDKKFQELADNTNAYMQNLKMKRESIADRGIWTAKKRYILNVWDNEGVRYKTPELKIMGIEAVKSSTPEICRNKIKEALRIMIQGSELELIEFIDKFRNEFNKYSFEEIASPRGCSSLSDYRSSLKIYNKGTPIHVRGALLFNKLVIDNKLQKKYNLISDGDKVKYCYMKVPNPLHEDVFAILNVLPKQFKLESYIDYDRQFDAAFLSPLTLICDSIGWKTKEISTIENFFT